MGLGQSQIPIIQNGDKNIVQIQQNINKVIRNVQTQVDNNSMLLNQMEIVGEIKVANLTVTQFQLMAGPDWLLCNGQSCVGSTYSNLTGNNTVPTITSPLGVSSAIAMIKVN